MQYLNSTDTYDPRPANTYDRYDNTTPPSDIFMIAMIIAMMFCMTFCCLCLFCRRSSEFSLCGINFELNNEPEAILDELNELHEVLPLTPTDGPQYPILDIESRLRSDPPPPRYSEVDNSSFKWKFKSSSKKRNTSFSASTKTKRSSSLLGLGRHTFSFRRSRSLNQCQNADVKTVSNATFPALTEEKRLTSSENPTTIAFQDGAIHKNDSMQSKEDINMDNELLLTSNPEKDSRGSSSFGQCGDDDVFE